MFNILLLLYVLLYTGVRDDPPSFLSHTQRMFIDSKLHLSARFSFYLSPFYMYLLSTGLPSHHYPKRLVCSLCCVIFRLGEQTSIDEARVCVGSSMHSAEYAHGTYFVDDVLKLLCWSVNNINTNEAHVSGYYCCISIVQCDYGPDILT